MPSKEPPAIIMQTKSHFMKSVMSLLIVDLEDKYSFEKKIVNILRIAK